MPTKKPGPKKTIPKKAPKPVKLVKPKTEYANNAIDRLDLRQVGKKTKLIGINLAGSITSATLDRTMDGASTITLEVKDPEDALIESGIFDTRSDLKLDSLDIKLDGLFYRLVRVSKGDQSVTLTFEDRAVAILRRKHGPKVAKRDETTRAEFIISLVKEVKSYGGIKMRVPEAGKIMKIGKSEAVE